VEGEVPDGFGDERRCAPKWTRYATGWPARSRSSVISPGPAPATFVEADLGPAVGAGPVLTAPGPGADAGRRQAPGHCEATAYYPRRRGLSPTRNTRMTPRWASSSNGPTACGPSVSAMIASATPALSQLGSGRAARLGVGRRRHHGPRQPGRGRRRTDCAAPRQHGRSFIWTGSGASLPGACRRRNASYPGLRRPPAGTAPLCRYPPGRHPQRRVSRRSRRSCRRAWMRSCRRVWRRS